MAKAEVLNNIHHDGVAYAKGDTFEAEKEVVEQLIAAGALVDPNAPKEEVDTTVSDAEAKAEAIVAEAEKPLADAKTEAEKVAEAANEAAAKAIADAEGKADDIVKAAEGKAKETPAPAVADAKKAQAK